MSADAEAAYWLNAPGALSHGIRKPFGEASAGRLLMEIGAVLSLLPPPPARIVDFGVGTGWTSAFLARQGYAVLGCELSPAAVEQGRLAYSKEGELELRVHDFEQPLPEEKYFDAALWFDALHHSADEVAALKVTLAALKPGGICVVNEPGVGHADSADSLEAVRRYGVRERDMPPDLVTRSALAAGFASCQVFAHPHELHRTLYAPPATTDLPPAGVRSRLVATRPGHALQRTRAVLGTSRWGLVRLTAP